MTSTRARESPQTVCTSFEGSTRSQTRAVLGITDFVYDRLEVLELMPWMVGRYMFCPTRPRHVPRRITWIATWRELNAKLARITTR